MSRRPLNEFERIAQIEAKLKISRGPNSKRVETGIGDDAAVLKTPKSKLLLCSDAMVEKIHFNLNWINPCDLGHKALASCLSDIAAMNGKPRYALISLAIPKSVDADFVDDFYEGVGRLAHLFDVDVVGGDLTASPSVVFIDVIVAGETSSPILRSGARIGDWVAVSGKLGKSAAGLHVLRNNLAKNPKYSNLIKAHLKPTPRFDLLKIFEKNSSLCTSLIDVSDGLSSELHHLSNSSNVGFIIEESLLPTDPLMTSLAKSERVDPLQWVLNGGEDYELLATFDPRVINKLGGPPKGFTLIGRAVKPDEGMVLLKTNGNPDPIVPRGFDHFRRK